MWAPTVIGSQTHPRVSCRVAAVSPILFKTNMVTDAFSGPDCSETVQFWNNTGVLKLQGLHHRCETQCPDCPTARASSSIQIERMKIKTSAYALALASFYELRMPDMILIFPLVILALYGAHIVKNDVISAVVGERLLSLGMKRVRWTCVNLHPSY
jgi:hypothetical protein